MAGKIQSSDESIVNWVGAELEARGATNDMIYHVMEKVFHEKVLKKNITGIFFPSGTNILRNEYTLTVVRLGILV
jgi:hypothetical protein